MLSHMTDIQPGAATPTWMVPRSTVFTVCGEGMDFAHACPLGPGTQVCSEPLVCADPWACTIVALSHPL